MLIRFVASKILTTHASQGDLAYQKPDITDEIVGKSAFITLKSGVSKLGVTHMFST